MRLGPLYDSAKGQPRTLSPRDFLTKKLEIPLAPMVNRKSLERSRLQSTPPHAGGSVENFMHLSNRAHIRPSRMHPYSVQP